MHAARTTHVATILTIISVGFAFLWWYSIGYLFPDLHLSYQISALTFALLMAGPSVASAIAGLVLYVVSRKKFWHVGQQPRGLYAFMGLALMLIGGFLGVWYLAYAAYATRQPQPPYDQPLVYYLSINSPYFILFTLWIVSGLLMFADSLDALLTKRSASAQH